MICFVILHYQAIEETQKCVKTIFANTKDTVKIIIVDNASPNNSGLDLQNEYSENENIKVILCSDNLGFAKGNNLGYREAKKYNPDFIVVLNSDIELIKNDFSEQLFLAQNEYDFDVLGPDLFSTKTNSHQNPQRDNNFTKSELKKKYRKLVLKNSFRFLIRVKYFFIRNNKAEIVCENNYKDIQIGKVLHGAFYVFSRRFIEKHNCCFFNNTFMYFESYILHHLGLKENLIFLYYPKIKVIHHEDASTNATYIGQYNKSCFVNRCLKDSCKVFLDIFGDDSIRIG